MPESEGTTHDSYRGHPLPRRTSPANSVTLKHHRLTRDASLRASAGSGPANNTNSNSNSSPRRNSSGESHDTGRSDPRKWFDQSNQNPTATFDNNVMDVDPPFFQKESDSSNEDRPFQFQQQTSAPRLMQAQSSSADDYRSVIDDLTVEIQKLKEELKRYKQKGPDLLRKEKLFEIKIHGLPKRKKRELETTLRDFAASLEGSPDASSSQQRKSRHANRDNMYGGSRSMSKHASSSSGSNPRPVDSAYASMSTGANSSGASLGRQSMSFRSRSSEQKVENYLRDIPEGLYPRQTVMTDKEKKKLAVRRLEQLFTGKITGRGIRRILPPPPPPTNMCPPASVNSNNEDNDMNALAPVTLDTHGQQQSTIHQPPSLVAAEPAREARILPTEQQQQGSKKKSRSRDDGSASNSNGDQTEGNSSGGTNTSPNQLAPPEQRPTRPKDLDPDRVQVPSENMDYIRHLGLVPPELLSTATHPMADVNPDAEGWVYLNLLCNLAQLHIINVTPSFVCSAVSEMSTKFQLSPDGRKIRWRGGSEGARFTSESSGNNSQGSMDTEDTDGSNKDEQRKRQKTKSTGDDLQSGGSSSKHPSKFGPQISGSSESFHYKPLFVQQDSSGGNSSPEDTLSSFGPIEDSHVGESGWDQSGSGTSNRRKRRHDGAIIYYSGAPFCTDLSGDPGDVSPTTYMMSSGQAQQEEEAAFNRPLPFRSSSGSSLKYRPLSDYPCTYAEGGKMDMDAADPGLTTDNDEEASEIDFETPWTEDQQYIEVRPLEPCGLGGVLPDDHFMVVVTTARPKVDSTGMKDYFHRASTEEATDGIIGRLASMSTSSPKPFGTGNTPGSAVMKKDVEIHYMSGRIKRLAPVPLPPPAIFFPPFSTDTSSSEEEGMSIDMDEESSSIEELMSRQANPHQSDGYPDGVDLSSGDEDGEDPDDEPDAQRMYDIDAVNDDDEIKSGSAQARVGTASRERSKSANPGGSSAATAGGVPSCFSSSEDNTDS